MKPKRIFLLFLAVSMFSKEIMHFVSILFSFTDTPVFPLLLLFLVPLLFRFKYFLLTVLTLSLFSVSLMLPGIFEKPYEIAKNISKEELVSLREIIKAHTETLSETELSKQEGFDSVEDMFFDMGIDI